MLAEGSAKGGGPLQRHRETIALRRLPPDGAERRIRNLLLLFGFFTAKVEQPAISLGTWVHTYIFAVRDLHEYGASERGMRYQWLDSRQGNEHLTIQQLKGYVAAGPTVPVTGWPSVRTEYLDISSHHDQRNCSRRQPSGPFRDG